MTVKTYSIAKDGRSLRLAKNFTLGEFQTKDGHDEVLVCSELVRMLQCIREHFAASVTINSGYRHLAYNRRVGSVDSSFHVRGMAADFTVAGRTPRQVYTAINSGQVRGVMPAHIGLGLYKTFVHIDSRGWYARWPGTGVKLP